MLIFVTPVSTQAFSEEALTRAIRLFFPDVPEMVEVARCESGLRQYNENGTVLRGGWGKKMIGLFQLHETYHRTTAQKLGYDIDTLLGNLAYTRELYRAEGIVPWNSSKHCWGAAAQTEHASTVEEQIHANERTRAVGNESESTGDRITKILRYGMTDPEARLLRRALHHAGHPVTAEGLETNYFGTKTYLSLIAFQCEKDIACLRGSVGTLGLGRVDGKTQQILNTVLTAQE